jgi:hypothetical protein
MIEICANLHQPTSIDQNVPNTDPTSFEKELATLQESKRELLPVANM